MTVGQLTIGQMPCNQVYHYLILFKAFTNIFDSVPDFQRASESVVKEESRKPEKSGTKSSILHRIAGPPYDEAPVFLPTAATTKVPKM